MFRKTKRKIVCAVVFSLLALMAVTLTTIFLSNRIALRHENQEMLQTYVERYRLGEQQGEPDRNDRPPDLEPDGQPGGKMEPQRPQDRRDPQRNEPRFNLSTFYSVAFSETGEVLEISNGNSDLQSDESLLDIAADILESGRKSGVRGSICYLVEQREDYMLVAMIDSTIGEGDQQILIRQMLIIGAAAMVVLVVVSIFIARRIVRPLEENDKRQKRFVSDAGHELKTPIAVIAANSELLKRQVGENEWLNNINYENDRMSELVKQLLLLSRAESGETPKETVDFSKLADGEALVLESLAFEKGKCLEISIEPGLTVEGNPAQLKQLVSILLDNALDHGTGEVIALSLRRERHAAALTVTNDAEPMSEEQLSHLFDRFYRTDEARNDAGSHYGLGLSIAKAVTQAHGGQIHAGYHDGKVSFNVTMPLKKAEKN